MGFLGSLFGSDTSPKGTNLIQSADPTQLANAYGQTQNGLAQQQAFLQALQAQNGIGNQSDIFAQQQALANQLGQQAQGGGPNPALNQLNQATGQNVANQAALMAGQRGASANVGLLARQAAQQGAGVQQQAAGQAATMRAQQQLAAQQALQSQQGNLANLATQQVNQQATGLNAYNAGAQGQQANLLGATSNLNNANVAMQGNINNANAQLGARQGGLLGGLLSAAGSAAGIFGGPAGMAASSALGGGGGGFNAEAPTQSVMPTMQTPQFGQSLAMNKYAHGGNVGPRSVAAQFLAQGGSVGKQLQAGGHVPGKATVSGDSLKNDVVDAKLSPGEIVIPRSIAQGSDAPKKAAAFVAAILARQGR